MPGGLGPLVGRIGLGRAQLERGRPCATTTGVRRPGVQILCSRLPTGAVDHGLTAASRTVVPCSVACRRQAHTASGGRREPASQSKVSQPIQPAKAEPSASQRTQPDQSSEESIRQQLQPAQTQTPTARHTTHPLAPCLGRTLLIHKVNKVRHRLRPALRRPIVARLRRAAAAHMEGRQSAFGRGENRCIRRFAWTVSAEEMHDDNDNDSGRLLSPADVARLCGLSRRAVYRAISRGELRAARLCHRLRVQPTELERWIGEQMLVPASPAARRVGRPTRSVRSGSLRAMLDEAGKPGTNDSER